MRFRHHPDGHIWLGQVQLPLAGFLADEPGYALPPGATGRDYDAAAGRHVLYDGQNQWGGPVPWPDGDAFLAKAAIYAANHAARIAPPPPTLPEARAEALERIDREAEAARGRWITLGGGQALAYEAKRREAAAWAADPLPDPAKYPWARARAARLNGVPPANVTVAQAQAVIAEWAGRAAAWEAAGIAIEAIREGAKETVAGATTPAGIDAVLAGIVWPVPV